MAGDAPVWIARPNRDMRFSQGQVALQDARYGTIDGRLYAELVRRRPVRRAPAPTAMDAGQLARFRAAVRRRPVSGAEIESIVGSLDAAGIDDLGRGAEDRAARLSPRPPARDAAAPQDAHRRRPPGAGPTAAGIGREVALSHLTETWTACAPLLAWLDTHVGPAEEPRQPLTLVVAVARSLRGGRPQRRSGVPQPVRGRQCMAAGRTLRDPADAPRRAVARPPRGGRLRVAPAFRQPVRARRWRGTRRALRCAGDCPRIVVLAVAAPRRVVAAWTGRRPSGAARRPGEAS